MSHAQIHYTTGPSGTGKSYIRCAVFLLKDWLPHHEGVHYSNFPIGRVPADHTFPPTRPGETFYRRLVLAAAKKLKKRPDEVAHRVRRIPPCVIKDWMSQRSGPWEYFANIDLSGAHIALDECHNFIGSKTPHQYRALWMEWLGEARHRGAKVEFLSQNSKKVADVVDNEAGTRITLSNVADDVDPFFKIPNGDWYELRAKFLTGQYDTVTRVLTRREEDEKWRVVSEERFRLSRYYFQFYDSYSAPLKGGKAGQTEKRQFQRRGYIGLLWWFFLRHGLRVVPKFGLAVLALWVCFFGGGTTILTYWLEATQAMASSNHVGASESPVAEPLVSDSMPAESGRVAFAPGQGVPMEYVEAVELDRLQSQYERAVERSVMAEAEAERLVEAQRMASAVVLLTPEAVTLRSGFTYGVGDVVDFGVFAGREIREISYEKRVVFLDDGAVLRMGGDLRMFDAGAERDPAGASAVQDDLRSTADDEPERRTGPL